MAITCLPSKYISFIFDAIALSAAAVIWSHDILGRLISMERREFIDVVTKGFATL